jgi:hypothetical protein
MVESAGILRRVSSPFQPLKLLHVRRVGQPPSVGGAAFAANSAAERRSHFLEAFEFYARAADRARAAGWPDEAWRDWRYRRASLARLLAHDGLMREVAKVYDDVRAQYAAARPVPRLVSSFFTGN